MRITAINGRCPWFTSIFKKVDLNIPDCNIAERFIAGLCSGFKKSKWVMLAGLFFLWSPMSAVALPPTPTLSVPAPNATGVTIPTSFSWSPAGYTYALYVSKNVSGTYTLMYSSEDYYPTGFNAGNPLTGLTLTYGTQYRWNMRCHDGTGWSSYSSQSYFTTLAVPTAPTLNTVTVNDLLVSLSWTNNSTADQYNVHDITAGSFGGGVGVGPTTATWDLSSFGTPHCFTVIAHNSAGWSSESNQACVTPIGQVSLFYSPSNGSQYASGTTSANLSWGSSGATSYGVNVSHDNTQGSYGILANAYISNQSASGTSASITVANGQNYYWQVIGYNATGQSHWSSIHSFSVAAPTPLTPTLSSPTNGYPYPTGTTATTVYWNWSSNSDSYDVQVGGSCGDTSVYYGNTTNLSQAISGLGSGQTYNWQVRGHNNSGGISNYSSCYSFTIAPPIPGFSVSAPANGYVYPAGTTSTILYWNSATGATSYDLQVGGSCGATNIYSGNANNVSRTVSGLTNGQTYYWRMQANNSAGASGYSSCRSFSVNAIPPAITAITPVSGLNDASLNITNLAGTNFVSGATVKITKSGQSNIAATGVVFVNSTKLTCTFPISGPPAAATGAWNVVVTNPDTQSATLTNGFTVTIPGVYTTVLTPIFTARAATSLTASWPAVAGANYVAVLASDGGYTSIVSSVTQSGNTKAYSGLSAGTAYYFEVKLSTETDAAFLVNRISTTTNNPPTLAWTGETNYTADGLNPETGVSTNTFVYRVKYTDADNDAPLSGYPKVHIKKGGSEILGSPFTMAFVSGSYNTGTIYTYSKILATGGTDFTYYFEAQDINSAAATGAPTSGVDAPDVVVSGGGLDDGKQESFKTTLGDNLFNPKTGGTSKIKLSVPTAGWVSLKIYDLSGRLIRTLYEGEANAGDVQKDWDGRDDSGRYVIPGVYLLHYVYPGGKEVRKIGVKK